MDECRTFINVMGEKAVAVCTDGDNTAWAKNAAEYGIGLQYIKKALRRFELKTAFCGIKGYFEVKEALSFNSGMDYDSTKGLEIFYSKLKSAKIGRREEMESMAKNYISKHIIWSSWGIINSFENKFFISCNGSSVARAANNIFNFKDYKSNIDLFNSDGLIVGLKANIFDGETKAKYLFDMLADKHIPLKKTIYIGDCSTDIPALRMVGFPIASPFATDEVKALAHYVLKDKTIVNINIRR